MADKKGVVMLAGTTTLAIVSLYPNGQLSGRIILKKRSPDTFHPVSRHCPFFLASRKLTDTHDFGFFAAEE
jgi:hypothetical protein